MTKTKKQLRAEAVERLMHVELRAGVFFQDVVTALVGWGGGAMGTVERVRDLLTDDELGNSTESDGVDTREQLEAEAHREAGYFYGRGFTNGTANAWNDDEVDSIANMMIALLDRQAAITEREVGDTLLRQDEQIAELQDENARLRTCMESDKEQHDEILAENAAFEAELKLARGELKQALNNHAQAEQRMKRKEQELDRKLALPHDAHLKELYELAQRNYEREVAENADLRKVLYGIAKAARYRKLPKEAE